MPCARYRPFAPRTLRNAIRRLPGAVPDHRGPAAQPNFTIRALPLAAVLAAGPSFDALGDETAAARAESTLPVITVNADADARDGYQATTTRVGKVLQDPHEVPQAVTSITRTLMDEQKASSLREALRNVSGLTFNAAEGGRAGDNMMLRGFYTFGDLYLDGIRDTAQYNRETFNLQQVDVLRGAGAMLFGRGQAGGVINQVSKTPQLRDEGAITASIGTSDYSQVTADLNQQLGSTTAIRLNVMKRDEGSWRNNPVTGSEPELHRDGIALSAGFGLGTRNEFILSHVTTRTDDKPDYGFSFDADTRAPNTNFSPESYWGTDRNFDKSTVGMTTAAYTRYLSGESSWRTQVRQAEYDRSYWARTPNLTQAPNAGGVVVGANDVANGGPTRTMDYETLAVQSDYAGAFSLLGMRHDFLVGAEFFREDSYRNSLENLGGTTADDPPFYVPYRPNPAGNPIAFEADSLAAYVQDTVEFIPRWKATLGARRDYMDAEYSSATSPRLKYGEWSTRAALSFHPSMQSHYYVSRSDSFSPTADLYQLTVTPQPPERSEVVEVGAKWLLGDGDFALRAALYRAEKDWERNTDLESTAAILTRKRRTDGIELELAGRITQDWEVFAGVALMDSEILEVAENVDATTGDITVANPQFRGQRARNTPPYTVNVWTTYRLGGGWRIGGGAEAKGERYGYNPQGTGPVPTLPGETAFHPNTAPSYVRWDAMLAYEQAAWEIALNVQNLLDEVWYDAIYDQGAFVVPGTSRRFILSGTYRF